MKLNYDNLETAYYRARRGKRHKPEIIERDEHLEENMR